MIRTDDSFLYWLQEIRERPGLGLSEPSLSALVNFWSGYTFRQMIEEADFKDSTKTKFAAGINASNEESEPCEDHFMDGFHEFIHAYFGCEWTTKGWWELIIANSNSETNAFFKFYELFDEFLEQANGKYKEKIQLMRTIKKTIHEWNPLSSQPHISHQKYPKICKSIYDFIIISDNCTAEHLGLKIYELFTDAAGAEPFPKTLDDCEIIASEILDTKA